ncbi:hypothetical protein MJ575_16655 [Klebsiella pneumoniae]|nr:hypothetical protein MJ575_16655 [Klebsiella pneumoniae]
MQTINDHRLFIGFWPGDGALFSRARLEGYCHDARSARCVTRQRPPAAGMFDVTSAQSIAEAIAEVGEIDVLANNAGVGMLRHLEALARAIANLFATNTLGTIAAPVR